MGRIIFRQPGFLEIKGLKVPRVFDINKGRKTKSSCWCVVHAILRPWHPVISENDGVNNHRNETQSIDTGSMKVIGSLWKDKIRLVKMMHLLQKRVYRRALLLAKKGPKE